jgi:hypothetical protein
MAIQRVEANERIVGLSQEKRKPIKCHISPSQKQGWGEMTKRTLNIPFDPRDKSWAPLPIRMTRNQRIREDQRRRKSTAFAVLSIISMGLLTMWISQAVSFERYKKSSGFIGPVENPAKEIRFPYVASGTALVGGLALVGFGMRRKPRAPWHGQDVSMGSESVPGKRQAIAPGRWIHANSAANAFVNPLGNKLNLQLKARRTL